MRAVRAEMRKTARLGTNKAARTPTRSLNPTRKRTAASASSHDPRGSHEWSVGNQWAYARLSTHAPLRSVTCTRVLRLAVSASSGPPFPDACHGKIALASSSWNRWDSWRGGGLIAFDRGLMGVLVRGEERCGHRLLISDIELGYSWKIVRKCFVR